MTKPNLKADRLKHNDSLNLHPERVQAPHFQNSAFFDPQDLVQVKYEMLREVSCEGLPKAKAAALYGMSRPTFYQALEAFDREGLVGLLPKQRGPKGAHKLTDAAMTLITRRLAQDSDLNATALAAALRKDLDLVVHPRSIERALARKKKR
jgi:transposase